MTSGTAGPTGGDGAPPPPDGQDGAAPPPGGQDGTGSPDPAADAAPRLLDVEAAPPGTYGELEPTRPTLTDAQGRLRLSFSRVDTYANCPRKFRYRYLDRLPTAPSPHLSFGSSIHTALEWFHDQKLPEAPSEQDLLRALYDGWEHQGFADLPREEQMRYYRHAQQVLRRYHARIAPVYRLAAATEAWFELPIEYEAVVVGSIDRVDVDDDGELHVVDYKTNRRASSRAKVAGSLQLAIYALACRHLFGRLPRTVSLDFVVAGVEVAVDVDDLDLDGARQTILDTAAAIRAERFEPTPNRLCDWCDHRAVCPAWEGDRDTAYGELVTEATARRRQLARDVADLRALEEGLERVRRELDLDR